VVVICTEVCPILVAVLKKCYLNKFLFPLDNLASLLFSLSSRIMSIVKGGGYVPSTILVLHW
jgi:hypothetical protein